MSTFRYCQLNLLFYLVSMIKMCVFLCNTILNLLIFKIRNLKKIETSFPFVRGHGVGVGIKGVGGSSWCRNREWGEYIVGVGMGSGGSKLLGWE